MVERILYHNIKEYDIFLWRRKIISSIIILKKLNFVHIDFNDFYIIIYTETL